MEVEASGSVEGCLSPVNAAYCFDYCMADGSATPRSPYPAHASVLALQPQNSREPDGDNVLDERAGRWREIWPHEPTRSCSCSLRYTTLGQGAVPQNVSVMPHEDSLGCRDGFVSHTIAFAHPVVRCLRVASRVRPRQPDKRGAAAH
jgi:hypothetical protein